jgi:K+ transporter
MKTTFKIVEIINICGLMFLLAGAYGIAVTGFLQVLAAILFLVIFPKNKLIYIYFSLVIIFFLIWNGKFDWIFLLPVLLIFFLTFIIYNQKKKL